jgi:hypothetical protein
MIADNNLAYADHLRLALDVLNESSNLGLDDGFAAELRKIIVKQISISEKDNSCRPSVDEPSMVSR